MPVNIKGKEYITVAERVKEAGKDFLGLNTEVLSFNPVVIKATVTTTKGTYTGISYANIEKSIEKQSPYEVAETSAVGRALGFAGYGIVEGIASAEEMVKAQNEAPSVSKEEPEWLEEADDRLPDIKPDTQMCEEHQALMTAKEGKFGKFYSHSKKSETGNWVYCNGQGFKE